MPIQYLTPGYGESNESGARQYLIPGGFYLIDGSTGGGGGGALMQALLIVVT